jgi:hypothetical protein
VLKRVDSGQCSVLVRVAHVQVFVQVQRAGTMAASKVCCKVCNKPFYGKEKYIRCCGPCVPRFHISCLKLSETEYSFFTSQGESTFKCAGCVNDLRGMRTFPTAAGDLH